MSYTIEALLGEGGMGKVFAGTHLKSQTPVAFKVMTGGQGQEAREEFNREIRAVASLNHPRVVPIRDYGHIDAELALQLEDYQQQGMPYFVMDRADGNLAEAVVEIDFDRFRRIFTQLLDGLAHVHARGIVHCDLKPQNILWFRDQDVFKLSDFGIARGYRALEPKNPENASGTAQYMAPEQANRPRDIGPWTDLYGLGCLAYYVLTGRLPFQGPSFLAIIYAHQYSDPAAFEPRCSVPTGTEAWIGHLLAKPVRARFQCAADAMHALWALGDASESDPSDVGRFEVATDSTTLGLVLETFPTVPDFLVSDSMPLTEAGLAPTIPFVDKWRSRDNTPVAPIWGAGLELFNLREPPFVDRETEREALWSALRRAVDTQKATSVVVEGPAGMGKSRLCQWVFERASELGAATPIWIAHDKNNTRAHGLRGALTRILSAHGLDRRGALKQIAEWAPGLTELSAAGLATLSAEVTSDDDLTPVVFPNPNALHAALAEFLTKVLRRPAVIWVDDAQYGAETLRFIKFLENVDLPILTVLSLRNDLLGTRPIEQGLIAELGATTLTLGPIPKDDFDTFLTALLGLDRALVRQIADRTNCNPLFAHHLIADWIQRDVLELTPNGFSVSPETPVPLPTDLDVVWRARINEFLGRTGAPAERVFELGAVLGVRFERREITRIAASEGISSEQVSRVLDLAERDGLGHDVGEFWVFAHGMLHESLLLRIADANRLTELHAAVFRGLLGGDEHDHHFEQRLATHAWKAGLWDASFKHQNRAVRELDRRGLAGEGVIAIATAEQRLDAANAPHDAPARLALVSSTASFLLITRQFEALWAHLDDALARITDLHIRGDLLSIKGRLCGFQGNQEGALTAYQAAHEAFQKAKNLAKSGNLLFSISNTYVRMGDLASAFEYFDRAKEWALTAGDSYEELSGLNELLESAADMGDYAFIDARGEEIYDRCLRAGERGQAAFAATAIGTAAWRRHNHQDALTWFNVAKDNFDATGNINSLFMASKFCIAYLDAGQFEDAAKSARKGITNVEGTPWEGLSFFEEAVLAAITAARGQHELSAQHLDTLETLLGRSDYKSMVMGECLERCATFCDDAQKLRLLRLAQPCFKGRSDLHFDRIQASISELIGV